MNAAQFLMYVLFAACGSGITYLGIKVLLKPKTVVDFLIVRDRRGKTLKVMKENDIGLTCKKMDGKTYVIFKSPNGIGYTFTGGGRVITKFLAMEGSAYTSVTQDGPIEVKVTLLNYLKQIWGDKFFPAFYSSLPRDQKEALDTDTIGVTVEVEPVTGPAGSGATTAAIAIDEKRQLIEIILEKAKDRRKLGASVMQSLMPGLIGALLMYFMMMQGVI